MAPRVAVRMPVEVSPILMLDTSMPITVVLVLMGLSLMGSTVGE